MIGAAGIRTFQPGDEDAIWEIMILSFEAGEWPGTTLFDFQAMRDRLSINPESRLLALEDDRIVGYLFPAFESLVVHPDHRRQGHGTRLVERAMELMRNEGRDRLELAVPLGSATAEGFAHANGFSYRSSLWLLSLHPGTPVADPAFPETMTTRNLVVGQDEEAFVSLLNTSFADHPSPLSATLESMRHVHSLAGFDPSGFLLVFPVDDPTTPVAFCRTSIHDDIGHVELVGVLPQWRGIGLGRDLLRWGIQHLRGRGVGEIQLTVEAANDLALGLYERTGFQRAQEWPRWARDVSSAES